MEPITRLSPQALRRAADIKERIDELQAELNRILGGRASTRGVHEPSTRWFSAATRAKMRRAQKARWARARGARAGAGGGTPRSKARFGGAAATRGAAARGGGQRATTLQAQSAGKAKRRFSAEARARLAASARARWAKAKAQGKARL